MKRVRSIVHTTVPSTTRYDKNLNQVNCMKAVKLVFNICWITDLV